MSYITFISTCVKIVCSCGRKFIPWRYQEIHYLRSKNWKARNYSVLCLLGDDTLRHWKLNKTWWQLTHICIEECKLVFNMNLHSSFQFFVLFAGSKYAGYVDSFHICSTVSLYIIRLLFVLLFADYLSSQNWCSDLNM